MMCVLFFSCARRERICLCTLYTVHIMWIWMDINMHMHMFAYTYHEYDDADDTVIEIHDAATQWINVMMRSNVHRKQTDSITSSCVYAHIHIRAQKKYEGERKVRGRKSKQFNYSHWIMRESMCVCVCVCCALCAHGISWQKCLQKHMRWFSSKFKHEKSKHSSEWIWTSFNVNGEWWNILWKFFSKKIKWRRKRLWQKRNNLICSAASMNKKMKPAHTHVEHYLFD